ncbi:hypothetical protein X275_03395 [Marinitoga sp. 1197]|uniref:ATP synthase F1 subunit delta n=1 Tax=Marinitoga sp. 1197 TaxID=1428449 RepID=UPI0006410126|nr:ATP synthase F1 subunit delta [Marinitoga sp. 1197]KLO23250.1 hypothetical protein X275_03395 [Marinitoga sp. 1197]
MKFSISLATRYVEAFIEYLSKESKLNKLDEYVKALKNVVDKINNDSLFYDLIGNPLLPKDYIVMQIVKVADIDDKNFNRYIKVLVYKNRQLMIPMVYTLLEQKNNELKKFAKVDITIPYNINKDMINELKNIIHQKTGRKVILNTKLDEDLIGGIQLQLEDKIFDYSIKGILEKIGREYASKRG